MHILVCMHDTVSLICKTFYFTRYSGHYNSRSNYKYFSRLSNVSAYLSSNDNSNRYNTIKQKADKNSSQLPKALRQRSNLSSRIMGHTQHLHRTSQSLSPKSDLNRLVCVTQHFVATLHTAPFNDDDENIMEKAKTSLKERKQKKVGCYG